MADFADELSLAWCVLLNALVFISAYRFALRRMTRDRSQAALDSGLIGYTIQYLSVALPGIVGALKPGTMTGVAIMFSAALLAAGQNRKPTTNKTIGAPQPNDIIADEKSPQSKWILLAAALFAVGLVSSLVHFQSVMTVMGNDAMTYHLPAAVQWLQTGRLGMFPVWFFNPANTYSPLAGSTFIAWLIAPFDNDVFARFVEAPALLFVGLGAFQLMRQIKVETGTAALLATALVAARPFFLQSFMTKDDLFLTAFFICALVSMTPNRAVEKLAPLRLGLSVGLLLATKYTALFSIPILFLMIDGLRIPRWSLTKLTVAGMIAVAISGPWYWRNFWMTGNPVFPIDVSIFGIHLFRGLFSPGRSLSLRTITGAWNVLCKGEYGMPVSLAGVLIAGWFAMTLRDGRKLIHDPIVRTCLLGPLLGFGLFLCRSPFPEVRFVLPSFVLMFVALAAAIQTGFRSTSAKQAIALAVLLVALLTAYKLDLLGQEMFFVTGALELTAVGIIIAYLIRKIPPGGRLVFPAIALTFAACAFIFVYWSASLKAYQSHWFGDGSGWQLNYGEPARLWQFVDAHIAADATVAYTNLYMIYPMQGFALDRTLVYAPTRSGINSQSDLPWLGSNIAGEELVPATVKATVANPDRATWLQNLRASRAAYIVIGKGNIIQLPPEATFAAEDSKQFQKLFENPAGIVYQIN